MAKTSIEWTQGPNGQPGFSWNPIRDARGGTNCTKVSPGCLNCYASTLTKRFHGRQYEYFEDAFYKPVLDQKIFEEPLRRKLPSTYFVASMTDLFLVTPDHWLDRIFAVAALAQRHTFIVLTKRPERMQSYLTELTNARISEATNQSFDGGAHRPGAYNLVSIDMLSAKARFVRGENAAYARIPMPPLRNVWIGVTCENQEMADKRIPLLLETPAAIRWLSVEPMLGPVMIEKQTMRKLDWIVCGGESGSGARPMDPSWPRWIRNQCAADGVPFFMKQICERGKKVEFERWPDDLKVRQYPEAK